MRGGRRSRFGACVIEQPNDTLMAMSVLCLVGFVMK